MEWRRFVAAVFFGRLIRYLGEAYLAVRLGDQAMATLQQHYPTIAIALAVIVAVFLLGRRLMRKSAPA
jgi:membrane protein DedA with SNARE-associated domain